MDRESFAQKRQWAGDLKPSMKRRRIGHNYKSRCIYMITLVVEGRRPLLGSVIGDGESQTAKVRRSPLGDAVTKALLGIPQFYPEIEIWAHQVMPDHLHAIVFIKQVIPVHLGTVINGFKVACNRAYRSLRESGEIPNTQQDALWEKGYNDVILDREGQLQRMKDYIHDNPRRLAITVRQNVEVGQSTFAAQGNIFLLDSPILLQVRCSQQLTTEQIDELCQQFLIKACNGAVLVSPSISPGEKAIMRTVFGHGFPVIVLQENGFAPIAKPGGRRFDACAQGKLLMLAPWQHHNDRRTISRAQCLELNEMARVICEEGRGKTATWRTS